MNETLLILGASARAAAQSAVRAGLRVFAVDQFGDLDLTECCDSVVANAYPEGLFDAAQQAPPGPWLYTGGLENYSEFFARLADRELLGVLNPAPLRDPALVNKLALKAGLPPVAQRAAHDPPPSGRWLLKPRRSSGGWSIQAYDGENPTSAPATEDHYWQPWIDGLSLGAAFVFGVDDWRLIGIAEQLGGTPWTGGRGFGYCGSIGPLDIAGAEVSLLAFAEQLFATGLVRGLVGVDAILDHRGDLHVLEINPRYTASIELHERAAGIQAIAMHIAACRGRSIAIAQAEPNEVHGKAIIYASAPGDVSRAFVTHCQAANASSDWPLYADVPRPGTPLQASFPVVTVFASGGCAEEVRSTLRQRAAETLRRLAFV
jgi:predicted ATP-grasp superfamily ATP-dependent carboligase